jgi:hypothetical protein
MSKRNSRWRMDADVFLGLSRGLSSRRDLMIRCGRQANVAGKFDFVSKTPNKRNDRAWHICVD